MQSTLPQPTLPTAARRTQPADVSRRPAPADWPFASTLTTAQHDAVRNLVFAEHDFKTRCDGPSEVRLRT